MTFPSKTPLTTSSRCSYLCKLAASVLLLNLFVMALASILLSQSRVQDERSAAVVAQNLSQVLEKNISGIIGSINQALLATSYEAQRQLASGSIDRKAISLYVKRLHDLQPDLASLLIADSRGTFLPDIDVTPNKSVSVADRDFFKRLRDQPDAGLVISKPIFGRVSGKWVVILCRRLNHPDGSFAGGVFAAVALDRFRSMFAALDLGPHGLVSLRDADLSMVVRFPDPQGVKNGVGNKTVSKQFIRALREHPDAGSYCAPSGVDNVERFIAYRAITGYPAYVVVGLAEDDYLADWRQEAVRITGLVAIFSLVTVIAAFLFLRASQRQRQAVSRLEESERKYRLLFENMTTGFALHEMIYDERGAPVDYRFLEVNPAFERLTGTAAAALVGKTVKEVLPDTEHCWIERHGTVARTGEAIAYQNYAGELGRYYDVWAFSLKEDTFATIITDITQRKESEDKLRLMAQVFEQSGDAILITDPDNRIIATNRSFTVLTGYTQEDVLGQNPKVLKSGREPKEFYEAMWEALAKENYWQGEIWEKRKDGSVYPKWLTITAIRNPQGELINYLASFSDITARKMAEQKIEHMAHHDPLTNLPNRFSLTERLSHALGLARRTEQHLAVIFIDLDRFKNINDSLGHHVGDLLLFEVAGRLSASVRASDIVARLGGDEFVIVVPQIQSGIAAAHIVSKIQKSLTRSYLLDGHELHITPSIGISVFPHDGESVEELMKNADAAMYHAKAQGRNNYQFFKHEMNAKAHERLLLENDLRQAVERGEFLVYYQPQVDAVAGRVVGVEALVRWQHPVRGIITPEQFIPVAEETGLILPLGDFVLETACRQLASWLAEGVPPIRMAVNLSARQFQQSNLPQTVARILRETGIGPGLLELEITESVAMNRPEETIDHLLRFKDMGVELAIDDFGTGYSSLSYLKLFPVNRLKIDKSFVSDLETDANNGAIAAATIALAHTLGMEVVAEGVETDAQLGFLQDQKCEAVQGYFFSHPLPADSAGAFLRNNLMAGEPAFCPVDGPAACSAVPLASCSVSPL
jgi:diguanylate cyclase (GGDEF)-like protein/PAS domain S-box-containing protein